MTTAASTSAVTTTPIPATATAQAEPDYKGIVDRIAFMCHGGSLDERNILAFIYTARDGMTPREAANKARLD